jgi:type 1 glutamine amidotransferase
MKSWRAAAAAGALVPALLAGGAAAQTNVPGGRINQNLGEMDYGVCRGTDPACYHDWKRNPSTEQRVLLFTRTAGPRHAHLGPALPPGLNPPLAEGNVVQRELVRLGQENGFKVDYTEDLSVMTRLVGYHAVIFASTSRDTLDDNAKTALRQYIRAGGGFVGIHNAFGTMYNWPYYEGLLGGANFYDHGPHRDGDVVIVNNRDSSTRGLPAKFAFKDEWYNLVPFPTRVRFLATVDEKSWKPEQARGAGGGGPPPGAGGPPGGPPRAPQLPSVVGSHPGHGDFHPVAWCQYYDGGRAWLTTLGHDPEAWKANSALAGAKEFQSLIVNGIKSAMGAQPFCQG